VDLTSITTAGRGSATTTSQPAPVADCRGSNGNAAHGADRGAPHDRGNVRTLGPIALGTAATTSHGVQARRAVVAPGDLLGRRLVFVKVVPGDTVCSRWMPAPSLLLLAAALAGAAPGSARGSAMLAPASAHPGLRIDSARVDPQAVQRGLELRVGEGWQRWTIEVDDGTQPGQVDVRLRDRAGQIHARTLALEGDTTDERSRALASSLALLVEQLEAGESGTAEPSPAPRPERSPISGFLGVGPRLALGLRAPVDMDGGVSLLGGTWLVRAHVVPVGELAWARSTAGELVVDALRMGAGVLGGAAADDDRLWGGGGVLVRALWATARASGTDTGWWASPAVVGALQYRGRILVVGGLLGADLLLPPLRARGDAHRVAWSMVRPMLALHVGLRVPLRRRAG
jgi:hypothetical protein